MKMNRQPIKVGDRIVVPQLARKGTVVFEGNFPDQSSKIRREEPCTLIAVLDPNMGRNDKPNTVIYLREDGSGFNDPANTIPYNDYAYVEDDPFLGLIGNLRSEGYIVQRSERP